MATRIDIFRSEAAGPQTRERDQLALMKLLRPSDVSGLRLVRLGRACDGGYVVPLNVLGGAEACVSFGVGDDTSFEEDLARASPGIRTVLFDHTIERLPTPTPGFSFIRRGVCRADTAWLRTARGGIKGCRIRGRGAFLQRARPFVGVDHQRSLVTHLRGQGLLGRPVIVKLDVEGAEYDAIAATPDDVWRNVVCLVVELHRLHRDDVIRRAVQCLTRLAERQVLVHVHGNNNRPLVPAPDGLSYPEAIELTFVNRRFAPDPVASVRALPCELDRPGQMDRPDLELSFLSSPVLATAAPPCPRE